MKLYNTRTREIEEFAPQNDNTVKLYTCGPTVYDFLHVGNWAAYIYWDTLVRVLRANDYKIDRVMNITDVGHLVSDADEGEDKLEKGARREGKTAWDVAEFYTEDFLSGVKKLGLIEPEHIVRATEFIDQQIELVRTLKQKGFTYQINDGIYFDTSKFPTYADFAKLDTEGLKAGARVQYNTEKHSPSDFALWKFTPKGESRDMQWPTPADLLDNPDETVMGFPGWHLECSAMAMGILGETLDIHTGGIDHIPVHHTNEIAQSEAASSKRFSNFWLHNNHIKVDGTKISKSLGNGYTLADLDNKGFSAYDFKLFILQSHYRSEGNFTFDALNAAKNRLRNWQNVAALRHQTHDRLSEHGASDKEIVPPYAAAKALIERLNNDLDTPEALALVDTTFDHITRTRLSDIHRSALVNLLETIDETLGLDLIDSTPDISDEAKQLLLERTHAREAGDWKRSDSIRDDLLRINISVRDTSSGPIWEYA